MFRTMILACCAVAMFAGCVTIELRPEPAKKVRIESKAAEQEAQVE